MKIVIVVLTIICLFSCATTNTTTVNIIKPESPYSRIMVVTVTRADDLYTFNEEYYNKNIRKKFNNVHDLEYRNHLEKAVLRTIQGESDFPVVVKSVDVYTPIVDYTYEEFMQKFKETGCQAILFVNLSNYWTTENYITTQGEYLSYTSTNSQPNHTYLCYLLDQDDLQRNTWVGKISVFGTFAGYDTLNNHLARRLASRLRKSNYTY
jgi:hypothetical protein